jgi:8-oxo-dGTP pyrophosphatase MutT (NUDIX family)
MEYTYDGVPITPDEPRGATIVVRRKRPDGDQEYLILHRAHHGPDYAGDWAWTPPSGARQPGEPVLGAALRELAEEAGVAPAGGQLRVLDLSGPWARFGLDLAAGSKVWLPDAEHDRFEWVPAAEAISRCRPAPVADSVRLADSASRAELRFRPLEPADLPALLTWQHAPHAVRWFPEDLDLAAAERKYLPRIDGAHPVRVHVVSAGQTDCGFIQHYRTGDVGAAAPEDDSIGLDYTIGMPELTGRGLGPHLIWSYLRDIALPAHPAARYAVASPDAANRQSVRALQKAGFGVPAADEPGSGALCVLDLVKFFGSGAAAGPPSRHASA